MFIGEDTGGYFGALVASAMTFPLRDPAELLSGIGFAIWGGLFGILGGAYIGRRCGVLSASKIKGKLGSRERPLAALVAVLFVACLLGWLLMELFGGW